MITIFLLEIAKEEEKKIKKIIFRKSLENNIFINDPIPHSELLEKFTSYDLAIHSSSHDSGSMFLLEAITSGVPVLFLDTGGPNEIFSGINYPLKVDPNQSYEEIVNSFANKIEWYYDNHENFMEKFQKYRERIIQKYEWDNKAKQMVEIYKVVLNENSSSS